MPENGYKAPTISQDTYDYIMNSRRLGEHYEDTLRRLLGLRPRVKYFRQPAFLRKLR